MFPLLLLGSMLSIIVAVGMLLYAAVRRRGGKPIPTWATYGGLFAFGAGFSVIPIGWAYDPIYMLGWVAIPLLMAAGLTVTRRYRMTGAMLLGLALPSVLWWGWFIVADVVDAAIGYDLIVIGWFSQSLFVAALGVIGVVLGNRVPNEPPPSPDGPPEARVMVITGALQREVALGPINYPEVIATGASLLAFIAITTAADRLALPPLLGLVAAVLSAAAVGAEVWYWALSRRLRGAMDGFSILGAWETERWKRTVSPSVPSTAAAAREWLQRNPETPQNRWARVELLAWTGQVDEAAAVVERMTADSDLDRFDRVVQSAFLDWVLHGNTSLAELRDAAAVYGEGGAEELRIARAHVAYAEAQRAEASGGDWTEPLIALRNLVEPRHRVWRRDIRWPRFRVYLLVLSVLGLALATIGPQPPW